MDDFIVFTIPGSPFARAVMITLEEKGSAWQLSPLDPGSLKAEEHLRRHPFGKMPVLQHGDFILYETQAILRYLDRVVPDPPLSPEDPRIAARMDQLMGINDWYLFQGCANVIAFQRIVGPRLLGLEPDLDAIAAAMPRADIVFAQVSRFLADQPFLTGEAISLADLLIGPQIEFFARTPEWAELTRGRPNIVGWHERLEARSSFRKTLWERLPDLLEAA